MKDGWRMAWWLQDDSALNEPNMNFRRRMEKERVKIFLMVY
jgi:hypothetical protein